MPGFLEPVTLLNSFGTWTLAGLLLVVFIESGLLFPLLPGDSLLFTAGLVAAGGSEEVPPFAPLWVLMLTIPIAAILGDQVGYNIGKQGGTRLFKEDARLFKQRYLDEAHEFFEKYGPITIFLARFVPIVRTYAPLVAGAADMRYRTFLMWNVTGGIVWGAGLTLLGYLLGQISFIREHVDIIFIIIVVVSVIPIVLEVTRRSRSSKNGDPTAEPTP
ncbi:VTT domain-containing protein [Mycolicibacterium vaccae]|nr:VTT domain-containing protein [Mycolicibacterium vaccae]MCV7060778.1 VTT domain-containing protein [Mycolicibacterium vaccae]